MGITFTNARVLDGTGSPWFRGSITVRDGKIERLWRTTDPDIESEERIDVDGAVISPGFIDAHSHSDLRPFSDPALPSKTMQGVTTEILGQDGFSMAPLHRDEGREEWQSHLERLAGPLEGEWSWGDIEAYLDALDDNGLGVNVATFVGHGTVRYNVVGMGEETPTETELEEMADLVTEGLEAGAIGFSTGLVYTPQVYADTHEMRTLARRLAPYGRPFVAHIRSEGRWIWDAIDEFYDIGAEEGIPVHHSHCKVSAKSHVGKADRVRSLMDAARERGVDVTADMYPYTAGSTPLVGLLPPWVTADGLETTREIISDPEQRTELRKDIEQWRLEGWENIPGKIGWEDIHVANVGSETNEHLTGDSFVAIANRRGVHPVDVMCDLLLEEDFDVQTIEHGMLESDVRELMSDDRIAIGSDGLFSTTPHPRLYGTYPRVLGHYVREENHLGLAEAIRKMTSLPARAMGLDQKGVLRPGLDADLVVFDPGTVASPATYDRPRQYPTGIEHVLVNGEFVVRNGEHTETLPGRTIRHE
ncbi:N-acyl-D-amino-acid deacylase family protein [Halomontanus rarus]|uniref:N-acyl-D-amino-acid deacylase family protein n=1 Tax=Halomontanus rarus TaxID=3034020 RepID=UPI0023E84761|nr:D-aminoacylase [Halovivax sp. TS33]